MNDNSSRKQALAGTFLLTISAFIAKFLSAVYRIPFQNMVGNLGFYVYQQIYPIYGIGMTIALNGLPIYISKMVVDVSNPEDKIALIHKLMKLIGIISAVVFVLLQVGSQVLAGWMGDFQLGPVIRSVSWMFLFTPFLASWRGYFQGKMNMRPTAYSQVIEQLVRVTVILTVAYYFSSRDIFAPYVMGKNAMFSAPIAAIFSSLVIFLSLIKGKPPKNSSKKHFPNFYRNIMIQGGTLCMVSAVMILMQLIDSFTVVNGLRQSGVSLIFSQNIKGIYDRAQTIVQLGLVLATASVTATLPRLSFAKLKQQGVTFRHIAQTNIRVNLSIALAMSVGLLCLMPEINRLLFASADYSFTISVYCFSIVFATLLLTYHNILQSNDIFIPTMLSIIIGLGFKAGFNQYFVNRFGILGASLLTVISLLIMLIVLRILAGSQLSGLLDYRQLFKVFFSCVAMGITVFLVSFTIMSNFAFHSLRILSLLDVIICIPIGMGVFFAGCLLTNTFSKREWLAIPFVSRILKIKREK